MLEYPKALYRDGIYSAVADKNAEDVARADRWLGWHDDQLRMSAPPKAPEPPKAEPEQVATPTTAKPTLTLKK